MKFPILFVLLALGLISTPDAICLAADSVAAPDATANLPAYAPVLLPGQGLAQHDFVYSGEAKDERLFIVRVGRIVWSYAHSGRGEISDAVLQTNGNLLFAHQFGITEVTPDKRVVWNYDAPAGTEIHTAQPYGTNSVFFIQNGNPAKFILLNKTTGRIERQFELPSKKPNSVHRQFRRARLTPAGTILIAHLDLGKIAEYDWNGRVLWSYDLTNCWSAEPLANGNILAATSAAQIVREINRSGATVWEWTPATTGLSGCPPGWIRTPRPCRPSKSPRINVSSGPCAPGCRPLILARPRPSKFSAMLRRRGRSSKRQHPGRKKAE